MEISLTRGSGLWLVLERSKAEKSSAPPSVLGSWAKSHTHSWLLGSQPYVTVTSRNLLENAQLSKHTQSAIKLLPLPPRYDLQLSQLRPRMSFCSAFQIGKSH